MWRAARCGIFQPRSCRGLFSRCGSGRQARRTPPDGVRASCWARSLDGSGSRSLRGRAIRSGWLAWLDGLGGLDGVGVAFRDGPQISQGERHGSRFSAFFRPSRGHVTAARFETSLPRSVHAPRIARGLLGQWLPDIAGAELEDAKLLASELVTNAFVHGRGEIVLRAELDEDRLLVEVIDQGQGFERTVRQRDFESVGGRGLGIVDTVASRWGIHEGTTHVWFELEHAGPRLGSEHKSM